MKITLRVIAATIAILATSAAAATWAYNQLPAAQSAQSLFEAVIATAALLLGGMIPVGLFLIEALRQTAIREAHAAAKTEAKEAAAAAQAAKNERRVQWALRRVSVEIIDAVEETEQLVNNPHLWSLTPLDDDVWTTSRKLLADNMTCGPLHYALTNFYKRLRVLQKADYLRVLRMETVGAASPLDMIAVQAQLVIEAGHQALDLLYETDPTVAERINQRTELGPAFAEPAHAEAVKQQRSETQAA